MSNNIWKYWLIVIILNGYIIIYRYMKVLIILYGKGKSYKSVSNFVVYLLRFGIINISI